LNNQSRTRNTLRNFHVGLGAQVLHYALSFVTRTIFVMLLSVEYLGVNGLFTNILAVYSLAEAGVASAFVSVLYKPLHERDTEKLTSLMNGFRKAYSLIGVTVGIIGLMVYPFLDLVIKENNIENINVIYLMFLIGSVTSYLFKYKIAFLGADQKSYITTIYSQIFIIIQYTLQIIILLLTRDFILYLAIQIACPIIRNILLTMKIDRLYPFLKQKGVPLDKETREDLKKKIIAGIFHHFNTVVVVGTDSIVISAFLGVYWVGLYSNYLLIIGVVSAFTSVAFSSVTASVGNLTASSDLNKSFTVFQNLQFLNFILVGFSSVCFITLFNPFITLWIGEKFLLEQYIVILIVVIFYMGRSGMQRSINIFKTTTGLFYYDRYFALLEGVINIVASVYLAQKLGLVGVFLGTLTGILTVRIWTEVYVVFKYFFERSVMDYFRKYTLYGIATVVASTLSHLLVTLIPHSNWLGFFALAAACAVVTLGVFALLFCKTTEFRFFCEFFYGRIRKQRQHA